MADSNLIDLFFHGMQKLGPGSDEDTLEVLSLLPKTDHELIVDAGSGNGRQALALAKALQKPVHAIDTHEPFLANLVQYAKKIGVERLIQTHCMDMADIPKIFHDIDLLWSESAIYNIGFEKALKTWHAAIKPGGFLVVSELTWLSANASAEARQFFQTTYPDMQSVDANQAVAQDSGYTVLGTHTVPREAWAKGYYEILEPRVEKLLNHPDEWVKAFAAETAEEIRIFEQSENSYAYIFYILQKTSER